MSITFEVFPNQSTPTWGIRNAGQTIGHITLYSAEDAERLLPVLMAAEALRDAAQAIIDAYADDGRDPDITAELTAAEQALDAIGQEVPA